MVDWPADDVIHTEQRPHPERVLVLDRLLVRRVDDGLNRVECVLVPAQDTVVGLLHNRQLPHGVVQVPRRGSRRKVRRMGPDPREERPVLPPGRAPVFFDDGLDPAQRGVADERRGVTSGRAPV